MVRRILPIAASLFLVALIGGATNDASAQALKVGYTDHEIIIANMPAYQEIQRQLQEAYQGGQQELQTLYQSYQEKVSEYQKRQSLMPEERRAEREQELMQLQQDIQQQAQQKDQELSDREAELMRPLLERVQNAIDVVAQRKGLDLVLRTQVGAQPVLLYVNEDTVEDVTMEVAVELGLDVTEADVEASSTN